MEMIYGNKLKVLRERTGFTQEKLGEYIGVTKQAFNHFENEYTIIPIKHLNDICNYFDVSLDYIFNFTNNYKYELSKEINKNIMANRLKEFRKENKITQNKLSELLKTSQSTIADYERGKNYLPTPFLYTISKKYGISADYLLGKIDEPKYLTK